ncbi:hypothetical protein DYB25_002430 [Aphanomyces astaci]|uniref:Conserved oligomeric Golgi complex subunit 6 n=1 Tax=Aphanomyces astaci TaxID=112090 RepID=A0A397BK62_APHAT|nr:hypothetical protein DYB25_002430 [Aphanomyces astaci]
MSMLLQHRVKKLLSNSSELTQAKALLDSLPDLLPKDAASLSSMELRASLKSSLDVASLDAADAVLRETEGLLSSMDALKKQADIMDRKCRHVMAFLDSTERTSTQFVAQAAALRAEQDAIQLELDSTKDFLQKHQVSLDDLQLLEQAAPLTESHGTAMTSYFQLLHRLQTIRSNCEHLVATNPAASSLEYLEDICKAQALAFEKLYAWASVLCNAADAPDDHLSDLQDDSTDDVARLLPQALRFLRGHAAYYTYCVDALAQTRRTGTLRKFVHALTVGIPRPIEIHAHDPVRYAAEMLAWRLLDSDHVRDALSSASAGLSRPLQGHLIDSYVDALLPHGIDAAELAKVLDPLLQTVLLPLDASAATIERNVFAINQLACVHAGLEPDVVRVSVHRFCTHVMALHVPVLDRIGAPEWRRAAASRTADLLYGAYDAVYAFLTNHRPPYPPSTLVHTPQEIRTILDI